MLCGSFLPHQDQRHSGLQPLCGDSAGYGASEETDKDTDLSQESLVPKKRKVRGLSDGE